MPAAFAIRATDGRLEKEGASKRSVGMPFFMIGILRSRRCRLAAMELYDQTIWESRTVRGILKSLVVLFCFLSFCRFLILITAL